tara:strand:+ start:309 stop:746 length:438 start_codon:yes stop_codon:yes gene_type:complete
MLCARITEFSDCRSVVPEIKKLGFAWTPLFWLRVYAPDVLIYVHKTIPFSWVYRSIDSTANITQSIMEGIEPTQIEMDCLTVSYLDLVVIGIGIWLSCQILQFVAPLIVRSFQHTLSLIITYITMIYSMIVSLELQTVMVQESEY